VRRSRRRARLTGGKCFEEQSKAQEDDPSTLNAWRVATERENPTAHGRQRPGENGEGQPMTALSTVRRGIFERQLDARGSQASTPVREWKPPPVCPLL